MKTTVKPLNINEESHRKLKIYCAKNRLKMKPVIEQMIEDLCKNVKDMKPKKELVCNN